MLKKAATCVLASLRASTYRPRDKSLSWQAWGGRVKWYASAFRSLRPSWTAFLNIVQLCCRFDRYDGGILLETFFNSLLGEVGG